VGPSQAAGTIRCGRAGAQGSPARLPFRSGGNMVHAHGYQVVIEPDGGCAVCIWESGKLPRYIRGFGTEAEARAWIAGEQNLIQRFDPSE